MNQEAGMGGHDDEYGVGDGERRDGSVEVVDLAEVAWGSPDPRSTAPDHSRNL